MDRRRALHILGIATGSGILVHALLFGSAIGINVPIAITAVLAAGVVARSPGARFDPADRWLPIAALAFAAMPALRSDSALLAFDLPAAICLTVASVAALDGVRVTRRTIVELVVLASLLASAIAIAATVALRAGWPLVRLDPLTTAVSRFGPVLRGLAIALPVLAVFALLFSSADAVFAAGVAGVFDIRIETGDLASRLAFVIALAWLVAGALAGSTFVREAEAALDGKPDAEPDAGAAPDAAPGAVGRTEALVVLVLVDLLFAVFVVLQVAYLFGGQDTRAAAGLTYSDYARRGFAELVGAAILAAGLLASIDAVAGLRGRALRASAGALVVLALVVLVSSALRLRLYQDAYGWTELRFYVYAAIGWIAVSLTIGLVLLVRERMRWLWHGIGFAALGVAIAANAIGPVGFVVDRNVDRVVNPAIVPADGRSGIDAGYVASLGDDAIPALVAALPVLAPGDRAVVREALDRRRRELATDPSLGTWPSWSLARQRARDALATLDGR